MTGRVLRSRRSHTAAVTPPLLSAAEAETSPRIFPGCPRQAIPQPFITSAPTVIKLGAEEIRGLIPEFRPGDVTGLSAAQWVEHVDRLRLAYLWDDRSTLMYATLRLRDAAQFWLQTRDCIFVNWESFKIDFVQSFPRIIDEASVHAKLAARKRKPNEPIESYFYEMSALAKSIKLSEQGTINYVISGVGNRELKNILTAVTYTNPVDVLNRIKVYESLNTDSNRREDPPHNNSNFSTFHRNPRSAVSAAATSYVNKLPAQARRCWCQKKMVVFECASIFDA